MQKINPFLWFNNQAEEAVKFYTAVFKGSKIVSEMRYGEAGPGPKGSVMTETFQLDGRELIALNGGPEFTFTPAISFFVNCKADEIDGMWSKLSSGGTVFMELTKYPFSEKFGWLQDKFGVSWQLNLATGAPQIDPFLMFVGKVHGKAEEAIKFYTSLFKNSRIEKIDRWGKGEGEPEGTVKHATFSLDGQQFMASENTGPHQFTFSPAISFFVNCKTQAEVDELWEKLSEGGKKNQCGWLDDKYGVTWQIVPTILGEMLQDKNAAKAKRVTEALYKMNKIVIKDLQQAYEQA